MLLAIISCKLISKPDSVILFIYTDIMVVQRLLIKLKHSARREHLLLLIWILPNGELMFSLTQGLPLILLLTLH